MCETRKSTSQSEFVQKLLNHMHELQPTSTSHHDNRRPFMLPGLATATHAFVRNDTVKPALTPPYNGPYDVESRAPKTYVLKINNKSVTVSIDRIKPAFVSHSPEEAQHPVQLVPASGTKHQTTDSEEKQPTSTNLKTRLGRTVRLPSRYAL
ncbi:PREDICTED: uncharacterized protein LOC108356903 [Rhagoletis zephyria]|uniref:uncharacterized protein LOC108356903 n=1 Tax=Rhagoletis zephyria TaxID=28612 RepID=UPI0008118E14|nr:PREDICTED: uncharacterized protein LOC108356903 [Rhagoletis zephyria]